MERFISNGLLAVVAVSVLGPRAYAAQPETTEEEVVVTGIRLSVSKSIEDKRHLDVVADVITAEDVGKFPDHNVAEALQRVTGVQITREANEGKFVNVRGLPSEFNFVTLNGQAVTSASDNQIVRGADRNFDFSLLAPDFVAALAVYKTARADLEEGAVAATINIKTLQPFDIDGRRIAFSAQAQKYDIKDEPEPNLAGLYSDRWLGGRVGLTVGAAWNRRFFQGQATDTAQLDPVSLANGTALILNNNSANFNDQLRDTKTYYGAVQLELNDSMTASVTTIHAKFAGDSISGSFALRPVFSFEPATFDYAVNSANVLTRAVGDDIYIGTGNFHQWDEGELDNHTLRLEWLSTVWKAENQLAYSESTTHSEEIGFDLLRWGSRGFGTAVSGGYDIIPGEPIPSFVIDPRFDVADPSSYLNGYIGGQVTDRRDRLWSEQLDVTYTGSLGVIKSIKGGLRFADRSRDNGARFLLDSSLAGTDISRFAGRSPVHGLLANYHGGAVLPGDAPYYDSQLYLDAAFDGSYRNWARAPTTRPQLNPGDQYRITEETSAAYLMADFRLSTRRPVRGNFGVRVVRTEQTITNSAVDFDAIQFIEPAPMPPAPAAIVPPAGKQTFDRSYTDVLPSLNTIVDLSQDLLLRFSAARVLSRPTLESLVPRYSVTVNPALVSGGNPDLDPFRADQYDLSLEWYARPGSLLSVSLFDKQIRSFIQKGAQAFDIQGRTFNRVLPVNGQGGYVRGAELGYAQSFDFLPSIWSGLGVQANLTYAKGQVDADPVNEIPSHPFSGLSKFTYNIVAFYEKYGFSLRLAYNSRDPFLVDPDIRGEGRSAAWAERFSTLDLQAGYELSNQINVYFEGNNLLGKETISSLRPIDSAAGRLPLSWAAGDRRLALGLRLKF
ncbi:TonB-dependent receptor [Peristeroidobacter soli]|jgi:TonB-dependent receptor|uniref:TonB-dependent receptor n=1 Tax=Peristeroidobacter soli TaxID=2497877 RepID=UPI00101BCCD1|nr:TonB-dependent receptor [Peristeroidobacter soli]